MLKSLFALGLAFVLGAGAARADEAWVEGKNYSLIEPAQVTSTGDKIEVVEAFSYGCTHCNEARPLVDAMAKRMPANAAFIMLPVQFGFESWKTFARAFYTAQALGLVEKTHADLFRAIYVERKIDGRAPTMEALAEFYAKYGVSAADFLATSRSFAIETRMKRNETLMKAYGVDATPTFIVNGKYRFTGATAGGYEKVEPLVRYLIEKETR